MPETVEASDGLGQEEEEQQETTTLLELQTDDNGDDVVKDQEVTAAAAASVEIEDDPCETEEEEMDIVLPTNEQEEEEEEQVSHEGIVMELDYEPTVTVISSSGLLLESQLMPSAAAAAQLRLTSEAEGDEDKLIQGERKSSIAAADVENKSTITIESIESQVVHGVDEVVIEKPQTCETVQPMTEEIQEEIQSTTVAKQQESQRSLAKSPEIVTCIDDQLQSEAESTQNSLINESTDRSRSASAADKSSSPFSVQESAQSSLNVVETAERSRSASPADKSVSPVTQQESTASLNIGMTADDSRSGSRASQPDLEIKDNELMTKSIFIQESGQSSLNVEAETDRSRSASPAGKSSSLISVQESGQSSLNVAVETDRSRSASPAGKSSSPISVQDSGQSSLNVIETERSRSTSPADKSAPNVAASDGSRSGSRASEPEVQMVKSSLNVAAEIERSRSVSPADKSSSPISIQESAQSSLNVVEAERSRSTSPAEKSISPVAVENLLAVQREAERSRSNSRASESEVQVQSVTPISDRESAQNSLNVVDSERSRSASPADKSSSPISVQESGQSSLNVVAETERSRSVSPADKSAPNVAASDASRSGSRASEPEVQMVKSSLNVAAEIERSRSASPADKSSSPISVQESAQSSLNVLETTERSRSATPSDKSVSPVPQQRESITVSPLNAEKAADVHRMDETTFKDEKQEFIKAAIDEKQTKLAVVDDPMSSLSSGVSDQGSDYRSSSRAADEQSNMKAMEKAAVTQEPLSEIWSVSTDQDEQDSMTLVRDVGSRPILASATSEGVAAEEPISRPISAVSQRSSSPSGRRSADEHNQSMAYECDFKQTTISAVSAQKPTAVDDDDSMTSMGSAVVVEEEFKAETIEKPVVVIAPDAPIRSPMASPAKTSVVSLPTPLHLDDKNDDGIEVEEEIFQCEIKSKVDAVPITPTDKDAPATSSSGAHSLPHEDEEEKKEKEEATGVQQKIEDDNKLPSKSTCEKEEGEDRLHKAETAPEHKESSQSSMAAVSSSPIDSRTREEEEEEEVVEEVSKSDSKSQVEASPKTRQEQEEAANISWPVQLNDVSMVTLAKSVMDETIEFKSHAAPAATQEDHQHFSIAPLTVETVPSPVDQVEEASLSPTFSRSTFVVPLTASTPIDGPEPQLTFNIETNVLKETEEAQPKSSYVKGPMGNVMYEDIPVPSLSYETNIPCTATPKLDEPIAKLTEDEDKKEIEEETQCAAMIQPPLHASYVKGPLGNVIYVSPLETKVKSPSPSPAEFKMDKCDPLAKLPAASAIDPVDKEPLKQESIVLDTLNFKSQQESVAAVAVQQLKPESVSASSSTSVTPRSPMSPNQPSSIQPKEPIATGLQSEPSSLGSEATLSSYSERPDDEDDDVTTAPATPQTSTTNFLSGYEGVQIGTSNKLSTIASSDGGQSCDSSIQHPSLDSNLSSRTYDKLTTVHHLHQPEDTAFSSGPSSWDEREMIANRPSSSTYLAAESLSDRSATSSISHITDDEQEIHIQHQHLKVEAKLSKESIVSPVPSERDYEANKDSMSSVQTSASSDYQLGVESKVDDSASASSARSDYSDRSEREELRASVTPSHSDVSTASETTIGQLIEQQPAVQQQQQQPAVVVEVKATKAELADPKLAPHNIWLKEKEASSSPNPFSDDDAEASSVIYYQQQQTPSNLASDQQQQHQSMIHHSTGEYYAHHDEPHAEAYLYDPEHDDEADQYDPYVAKYGDSYEDDPYHQQQEQEELQHQDGDHQNGNSMTYHNFYDSSSSSNVMAAYEDMNRNGNAAVVPAIEPVTPTRLVSLVQFI